MLYVIEVSRGEIGKNKPSAYNLPLLHYNGRQKKFYLRKDLSKIF